MVVKNNRGSNHMTDFDLVCTKISTRFWRAGYANMLLFIGAVFTAIVWGFLAEMGIGRETAIVVSSGVLLGIIWYYSTFVSRVSEVDGSVQALKAFTMMRIPAESITSVHIASIRSSYFAKITINRKGSEGAVRLRLIAPTTNMGTFKSTISALENFAQRHSD